MMQKTEEWQNTPRNRQVSIQPLPFVGNMGLLDSAEGRAIPDAELMGQLCALVEHLDQFKLRVAKKMDEADDSTLNSHMTTKIPISITDMITGIAGFVDYECCRQGELFFRGLRECESRLVRRIKLLQLNFHNVSAINVTTTTEKPPRPWIRNLLQACSVGTDKQSASQDRNGDLSLEVPMEAGDK